MTDTTDIMAWRFEPSTVPIKRLIDALGTAKSPILHRVHLEKRTTLWSMDCTDILRTFARQCALDAIRISGCEAPPVVMEYLTTGTETLRVAAEAAANAAANAVAASAARAAAWDAARAAARAAAWAAAGKAAWDAQNEHLTAMVLAAAKKQGII